MWSAPPVKKKKTRYPWLNREDSLSTRLRGSRPAGSLMTNVHALFFLSASPAKLHLVTSMWQHHHRYVFPSLISPILSDPSLSLFNSHAGSTRVRSTPPRPLMRHGLSLSLGTCDAGVKYSSSKYVSLWYTSDRSLQSADGHGPTRCCSGTDI